MAPTTAAVDISDAAASTLLNLTARVFDGRCVTAGVQSTERVAVLKSTLERLTGIHKATQRLVFAGNTLKDDDIVATTTLVDGATLFMLELKTFPATLGPFRAVSVPLTRNDFQLPPLDLGDFDHQGAMWVMEQRAAARHGIRGSGIEFPLCGQFSPPHPVTLTDEEKAAISIPATATSFVFSYPVVAWNAMSGGSDEARSFLSVGGYAYLDAARRIIHTTTLQPASKDTGGLQFNRSKTWRAEWTQALMKQGRFQRITIQALTDIGAHHFCWVRPAEVIMESDGVPCAEQPSLPHGGFAYLFHVDVYGGTEAERRMDRYFPIASGDDYLAEEAGADGATDASEEQPGHATTFELVSSLATLQDLVDGRDAAVAVAASVGGGAAAQEGGDEELRSRINSLERQLDSVTKCVACLTEDKDTILLPCNHLCVCSACAQRVRTCPVCRARIQDRRKSYLS